MSMTVPADVWRHHTDGPLVAAIVEGEHVHTPTCLWGTGRPTTDDCRCKGRIVPPLWLVALRDARCETCNGTGSTRPGFDYSGDPCPNDRCHDGRLLHDVRVECEHVISGAVGWYCGCGDGIDDDQHAVVGMCETCAMFHPDDPCNGYRTVRCLVDVVPVVEPNRGNTIPFLCLLPQMTFLNIQQGVGELTPAHVDALAAACGKPPADWVGGYAVILTEVGE